jgi:hypothetical protein
MELVACGVLQRRHGSIQCSFPMLAGNQVFENFHSAAFFSSVFRARRNI